MRRFAVAIAVLIALMPTVVWADDELPANASAVIDMFEKAPSGHANIGVGVEDFHAEPGVVGPKAGAEVVVVIPGTPASQLGMNEGDVIVRLGSSVIKSADDFQDHMAKCRIGSLVQIGVDRKVNGRYVFGEKPIKIMDSGTLIMKFSPACTLTDKWILVEGEICRRLRQDTLKAKIDNPRIRSNQKEIDRAELKMLDAMKGRYLPTLEFKVGSFGQFRDDDGDPLLLKVFQVTGPSEMLVKIGERIIMVSGVSTAGIVDDQLVVCDGCMKVDKTVTYETPLGGSNTVLRVIPADTKYFRTMVDAASIHGVEQ